MPDRILIASYDADPALIVESFPTHETKVISPIETIGDLDVALARAEFDLIVLHLAVAAPETLALVSALRKRTLLPIMVLGSIGHQDAVHVLNAGADEYVSFSENRAELDARACALIRSNHMGANLSLLGLTMDREHGTVLVEGRHLHLTQKERGILEILLRRNGQPTSPKLMLALLYPDGNAPEEKIIKVFIHKLRRKLAETRAATCPGIQTFWGRGYYLTSPSKE